MEKVNVQYANRLINHGPLVVVSSRYRDRETFTPIAWNMPVEHSPPLIALAVSKENYLNGLIRKSGQFSVNVLESPYVKDIVKLGSMSGKDGDKLSSVSLTRNPCLKIKASYLNESSAVIECKLVKDIPVEGVNIFIGRAVFCQANEKFERDIWNPAKLKTIHHLGKNVFATIIKLEKFGVQ